MIDWLFRITELAAFVADLDAFCDQFGYPRLTIDDGAGGRTLPGVVFSPHLRFDFDVHRVFAVLNPVTQTFSDRGLHVNARGTPMPNVVLAPLAIVQLDADLHSYFSAKPTLTNTPPAPLTGGQVWHTTGSTVLIDPPPTQQKRVWA